MKSLRTNVNQTLWKRFRSLSSLRGLTRSYITNLLQKPIRVLRDTGASQSFLQLAEAIPLSEKLSSSKSGLIQGLECGLVTVPLHQVNLQSDLASGPVTVGA